MRPANNSYPWIAAVLVACSGEGTSPDSSPSAKPEWTRIIERTWTLGAGEEILDLCVQKELTEDIYISAIRPVHPQGTHHTFVNTGVGDRGCNGSAGVNTMVYGGGVGTEALVLPPGVALKLSRGDFLNMGLHLYNVAGQPITGTSAMEVVLMDPSAVKYETELTPVGVFGISIPPGQLHTQSGECTVAEERTVYAFLPHMHQLGAHFKATFMIGGEERVIHDAPYDFEEQYQVRLPEPLQLSPGDKIVTECTWQNTTTNTVTFGESSDAEMCFNGIYSYPKSDTSICGGSGAGGPIPDGPPCASPGDPGNDQGVGRECTAGGGQCTGGATICIADHTSAPFGNFCTKVCSTDADCGAGAVCSGTGSVAVCFPDACTQP
jgi:hypothetical protein